MVADEHMRVSIPRLRRIVRVHKGPEVVPQNVVRLFGERSHETAEGKDAVATLVDGIDTIIGGVRDEGCNIDGYIVIVWTDHGTFSSAARVGNASGMGNAQIASIAKETVTEMVVTRPNVRDIVHPSAWG